MGIDLLSGKRKACTFNCIYCQLGRTKGFTMQRKLYVPTSELIREIRELPDVHIDYITFSGRGEPTLAANLGEAIRAVKRLRPEPIAVLTNSTLLHRRDVREELSAADLVAVKLDAASVSSLRLINRPARQVKFSIILKGIRQFRKEFRGKLALQVMFMRRNKGLAPEVARLAKTIRPDEVQICTPTRPAAAGALSRSEMQKIKRYFSGMKAITPYQARRKKVRPINRKDTMRRRGKI